MEHAPETITIGPYSVPVEVNPGLTDAGNAETHPYPKIYLQKWTHLIDRETLLHECIHLISDLQGLGMTERQVQGLGYGIVALLRSNPVLAAELCSEKG